MINENSFATNTYLNWLRNNIREVKIGQHTIRMTLPFLNKSNDCTEFYIVSNKNDTYTLSDDGITIFNLESSGIDIKSNKRKKFLSEVLSRYGVNMSNTGELTITSSYDELAQSQHSFIQALIKVDDLFYLSNNNLKTIFDNDVKNFLDQNDVRYIADTIVKGESGLYSNYEFIIPHSKNYSERFVRIINSLDTNITKSIIFSWQDTAPTRKEPSKLIAVVNDTNKKVSSTFINALEVNKISTIKWTEKEKYISTLTA